MLLARLVINHSKRKKIPGHKKKNQIFDPSMMMQQEEEEQRQQPMLPMGYKFRPTDRELLFHFLKNKLKDPTMFQPAAPIYDIQLYDHHPQIILDNFGVHGHNNNVECYVFTMRHRKFLSGNRANRILKDNVGYWRASYSRVEDQFQERRQGGLVGERMNLVYYDTTTSTTTSTDTSDKKKGTKKGTKTDWLMNEYKIKPADNDDGAEEDLVLCRIYFNNRQRNKGISNHQQQQYYNMQQEQQDMQQQQQQEQQPAAVDDQASNTGTYSIDTEIDVDTFGKLMTQTPEPQQTGAGIFLPEQPHLQQQQQQQQQQEQQPVAVDNQAASNTGIYSIDTAIDADTFNQLMSQAPEPQQTGVDMISTDDYA